jgi:hypothetical protein
MDKVVFNNFMGKKNNSPIKEYTIAILSTEHSIASAVKKYLKAKLKIPCAINFIYIDKPKSIMKQPVEGLIETSNDYILKKFLKSKKKSVEELDSIISVESGPKSYGCFILDSFMYKIIPNKHYLHKTYNLFKNLVPYKHWEYSCSILIYDLKTKDSRVINSKPSLNKKASISIENFLEYLKKKKKILFKKPYEKIDSDILESLVFKTMMSCDIFKDINRF